MTIFLEALAALVGPAALLIDAADVVPYATDWRGKIHGVPLAVVRPASTAEVSAIVRLCAEHGVAIVPQGGNSGLAGGATPDASAAQLVLALDRMTRILAVDPIDNVILAEAGCILAVAQQAAADIGRLLPLSFGAEGSARLGGAVATNAGGINVLRYGNTRQLVLGVEVVLPDGEVLDLMSRLRKDNAGYDLKQLFIGSEGTLGIITAVCLRLVPRIAQTQTAVLQMASLDGVLALYAMLSAELGEFLTSFELISPEARALSVEHLPKANWPFSDGWAVLVEIGSGSAHVDLAGLFETALGEALEAGIAADVVIAQSDAQRDAFWLVRESITEGERAAGPSIKHDVSVPISRLPALIVACEADIAAGFPGARANVFGHVGDGNVHFNVIPTAAQRAEPGLEARINSCIHDRVVAAGGSITAEHGVGQLRVDELAHYKGADALDLMRRIKRTIDPRSAMNPGKILRLPDAASPVDRA
jgi:FAD/FMN-containing dehydrogenase